jgi:hypothetical protein
MNHLNLVLASLEKSDLEIYCCLHKQKNIKIFAALFHLNLELAKINQNSGEKLISEVKLSWWFEILDKIYKSEAALIKQPTILLLQEVIKKYKIKKSDLKKLIKAREIDFSNIKFKNFSEIEKYVDNYFVQIFIISCNALKLDLNHGEYKNLKQICYLLKTARIINSLPKYNYNNHPFIDKELQQKLAKHPAIKRQEMAINLLKDKLKNDLAKLNKLDFPHNFLNNFANMVLYYCHRTIKFSNERQIIYIAKYHLLFNLKLKNFYKKLRLLS